MRLKGEQNSNHLFYLMKHNIKEMINQESGTVFGSVYKKDILGLEVKITNIPLRHSLQIRFRNGSMRCNR